MSIDYGATTRVKRRLWTQLAAIVLIIAGALVVEARLEANASRGLMETADSARASLLATSTAFRYIGEIERAVASGGTVPQSSIVGLADNAVGFDDHDHAEGSPNPRVVDGYALSVSELAAAVEDYSASGSESDRQMVIGSLAATSLRLEQVQRLEAIELTEAQGEGEVVARRALAVRVTALVVAGLLVMGLMRRLVKETTVAFAQRDIQRAEAVRRADQQQVLAALATASIATPDLADLRSHVAGALADHLEADGVMWFDVIPGGQSAVAFDDGGHFGDEHVEVPIGPGTIFHDIHRGEGLAAFQVDEERHGYVPEICLSNGVKSGMVFRSAGVRGTVSFVCVFWKQQRSLDQSELEWAQAFSDIATLGAQKIWDQTSVANALSMAEEASAAKSRFMAHMSHELRTPLAAVIGYASVLGESAGRELTAEEQGYAAEITRSGEKLLALINNILDLSKVEAGSRDVVFENVDLAELVDEVAADARIQLRGADLEVGVEIASASTLVRSESVKLRQVLVNLVNNAAKYTPSGRITLRVVGDESGPERIEVEDTGIGIPADKLEVVMRPFEQLEADFARAWGGTGLGLAIVNVLVSQLGHRLDIRSEVGEGSVFSVHFVRARSSSDQAQPSS